MGSGMTLVLDTIYSVNKSKLVNQRHSLQLFVVEFDTCLVWELLLLPSNAQIAPNLSSLKGNIRKAWLQLFECFPFPSWLSLTQFSKQESLWFTFIYGTLWTTTKLKWEKPHLKTLWSATHSYCRREKWITPPPWPQPPRLSSTSPTWWPRLFMTCFTLGRWEMVRGWPEILWRSAVATSSNIV